MVIESIFGRVSLCEHSLALFVWWHVEEARCSVIQKLVGC